MTGLDRVAFRNRWRGRALSEKACLAFGALGIVLFLPTLPVTLTVFATMSVLAVAGARVPWSAWTKAMLPPAIFAALGGMSLLFQLDGGRPMLVPGGSALALTTFLRALSAVACLLFLAMTTPAADLVAGARRIGLPAETADMALLTYRFIFLLGEGAATMFKAQTIRLGYNRGPKRAIAALGLLAAALLPRATERARRLETGLAARGWNGSYRVLAAKSKASLPVMGAVFVFNAALAALGLWTR